MGEQRDCSCGGSNANCARCGGSGFVWIGVDTQNTKPDLPQLVGPPAKRQVPLPIAIPRRVIVPRDIPEPKRITPSRARFSSASPSKAAISDTQGRLNARKDSPATKSTGGSNVCPLCSAMVRADRLDAHVRLRCAKRANKGPKRQPAQKGQKRPSIVLQHGWAQKARRPKKENKKYPISQFDGQPRFEGGLRFTQGGLPGSGRH
jgi:hypothetical protein